MRKRRSDGRGSRHTEGSWATSTPLWHKHKEPWKTAGLDYLSCPGKKTSHRSAFWQRHIASYIHERYSRTKGRKSKWNVKARRFDSDETMWKKRLQLYTPSSFKSCLATREERFHLRVPVNISMIQMDLCCWQMRPGSSARINRSCSSDCSGHTSDRSASRGVHAAVQPEMRWGSEQLPGVWLWKWSR